VQVRHGPRHGRRWLAPAALALLGLLPACTAQPPPVVESTATTATPPPSAVVTNTVVVAIDDVGGGFNPHKLADLSPVNTAVSSLVLPSVFRPDASTTSDNSWVLDGSTAISATPSSATTSGSAPFTVTYVLRNEAQWSDGAPIAAEDFRYLWQQMITQPGVADGAGYSLIDDVASSAGGKTVTVTFTAPYPAWRQLFRNLLPAHLLKDLPGGFTGALDSSLPVSGSRFKVKSIDRDRGEVLLERNDRFWDKPTVLDSILLRRDGTAGQLAESLRSKDAQLAQVHANDATRTQLAAIPELQTLTVPQPTTMRIALDVTQAGIPDRKVREGLLGLLDADALSTIGAGRDVGQYRAGAQVLVPSQPGYVATRPESITPAAARTELLAAGYTYQAGKYLKNGTPLTVVVGAAKEDSAATSVAQAVADQLTVAGVDATASIVASAELYGRSMGSGTIGMLVGRAPAGGDAATTLAGTYACVKQPGGAVTSTSGTPTAPAPTTSAAPTSTATTSPRTPATVRLGNVSGVCDSALQPLIQAALTGTSDATATVAALEPKLWDLHAVLPLYQDATLLAVRKQVNGVGDPGPLLTGPFSGAATWTRTDR
jgi:ABC-type transport system substrate-binding protein